MDRNEAIKLARTLQNTATRVNQWLTWHELADVERAALTDVANAIEIALASLKSRWQKAA